MLYSTRGSFYLRAEAQRAIGVLGDVPGQAGLVHQSVRGQEALPPLDDGRLHRPRPARLHPYFHGNPDHLVRSPHTHSTSSQSVDRGL